MTEPVVVILMGLPGAGKSTFRRTHFNEGFACVSKDHFRSQSKPARRQANLIREALQVRQSVVVDNTSVTVEDRAVIVGIAREFGVRVEGYVLQASVADCRERNAGREGKAQVPLVAIYTAAKKWCPPTLGEGFDALYIVQVAEGVFEVAPYSGS
jgi:predicted kinase